MSYQTTANSNAFIIGSCRVSIPSSSGGYVDLGAARGVKLTESWDVMRVEIDNTPPVIVGAKKQVVEVEGNLLELDFHKLATLRGGIDTWTPVSTTDFTGTFISGGKVTVTPQALYLTHTGASSSETVVTSIYWASVTEGLTIPFPSDDATDVSEIPFKMKGVCVSTKTSLQQLYNIVDLRNNVYSTTYFSTSI
jgi:hypothetical protein